MTQNYPKNVRNLDAFWHLKLAKSIHGLAYAVTMALGGGVCRAGVSGEEGSGVLTPLGHVTVPPPPSICPIPGSATGWAWGAIRAIITGEGLVSFPIHCPVGCPWSQVGGTIRGGRGMGFQARRGRGQNWAWYTIRGKISKKKTSVQSGII